MPQLVRGTIRGFDPITKTATIELDGSVSVYLDSVPCSRGIPDAELVAGVACVVAWDGANPDEDALVLGVY